MNYHIKQTIDFIGYYFFDIKTSDKQGHRPAYRLLWSSHAARISKKPIRTPQVASGYRQASN